MRRSFVTLVLVAPALLGAACGSGGATSRAPVRARAKSRPVELTITPDGTDRFVVDRQGPLITFTAPPTNTSGDLRIVGADLAQRPTLDQQACVTWAGPDHAGHEQPGVALQVRPAGGGGVKALTVTDNVFAGWRGTFNVHAADSTKPTDNERMRLLGQIDAPWWGSPLPWRFCARIDATTLSFKGWSTATEREPSWDDPGHGRTLQIDPAYLAAGVPGWYMAHLAQGDLTVLRDLEVRTDPRKPTG